MFGITAIRIVALFVLLGILQFIVAQISNQSSGIISSVRRVF